MSGFPIHHRGFTTPEAAYFAGFLGSQKYKPSPRLNIKSMLYHQVGIVNRSLMKIQTLLR